MKSYLVPREIAESLGLTAIRMSTNDGTFLLSEHDIVAYGKQKAIDEGAVELSTAPSPIDSEKDEMRESADNSIGGDTEDFLSGENNNNNERED